MPVPIEVPRYIFEFFYEKYCRKKRGPQPGYKRKGRGRKSTLDKLSDKCTTIEELQKKVEILMDSATKKQRETLSKKSRFLKLRQKEESDKKSIADKETV